MLRFVRPSRVLNCPALNCAAVIADRVSDVVCPYALNQSVGLWTDPGFPRFPRLHRERAEHDPGVLLPQRDLRAIGVEIVVEISIQIDLRRPKRVAIARQ
jgi:hypothetical protein